ncbi:MULTISPECIES: 2-amino-4-hydroxy-6-hydroxymethyldihydropteridine diphosphokinase [unclassified Acinetobacter]|uniref:2-amino-4-hydroxy-6- hydroxymethyldihydropteridine diphosphokinase n=1 Tax=unclassified Acinetobacter TaxID=196816 RepID=UPI0035B6D8E2
MKKVQCFIGLGGNLGDSRQIFVDAIDALAKIGEVRVSSLYSSPPMGPQDQPDYLNAVVELWTDLAPLALLDRLQYIENESGRVRLRHWGERTLDLDLLLYGDEQIDVPRLKVPHVGLFERDFVVLPLLDLEPNKVIAGQVLQDLACVKNPTAQAIDADWYHSAH